MECAANAYFLDCVLETNPIQVPFTWLDFFLAGPYPINLLEFLVHF